MSSADCPLEVFEQTVIASFPFAPALPKISLPFRNHKRRGRVDVITRKSVCHFSSPSSLLLQLHLQPEIVVGWAPSFAPPTSHNLTRHATFCLRRTSQGSRFPPNPNHLLIWYLLGSERISAHSNAITSLPTNNLPSVASAPGKPVTRDTQLELGSHIAGITDIPNLDSEWHLARRMSSLFRVLLVSRIAGRSRLMPPRMRTSQSLPLNMKSTRLRCRPTNL